MVPHRIAWARKKGMAWNTIRGWTQAVTTNAEFASAFGASYDAMDLAGINADPARSAWQRFRTDMNAGKEFSNASGQMMSGFMLGAWLRYRYGAPSLP